MSLLVNGEVVYDVEIQAEMDRIRPALEESMTGQDPVLVGQRLRDWARETVIDRVLLRQAALRDCSEPLAAADAERHVREILTRNGVQNGCRLTEDDPGLRRAAELQIRVTRLCDRLTERLPPPSEEEIAVFYHENLGAFRGGEVIHASHVVKHVHQAADEAAALNELRQAEIELAGGASFADVANRYSDCPGEGGDLGEFRQGQMVDEFERALTDLQPGGISGIFRSPFGFHIAQLHQRRETAAGLDEVRPAIRHILLSRQKELAVETFVDGLRDTAIIESAPPSHGIV